ncbi:unnamed protein product [Onchocerca ochengi]|uniref:CC domain-containing protein n=1 Tax=Onchocerca ochengi TaxID=42157 RepID=A0A182EAJ8_ONCOC|nr:unnamed protein product [Onchocerca ochengi]
MQCSQNNPCHRGTCNNGYCCTSSTGSTITNHPYASPPLYQQQPLYTNRFPFLMPNQMQQPAYNPIPFRGCANGGSPVGACINMRCARGYICSPGNICCPSNDYGRVISSTANPVKNPFLCTDGTQAAGACIFGQCGSSFTCISGLCCNVTNNTPRCLDGTPSVGACLFGHCGAGFVCTTGNLCCLTSSIAKIIPDDGFQCDTTINSCCPISEPTGTCAEPGDQCPTGSRCFKEVTTPVCFKECDGRGIKSGFPVAGVCQTGTTLIFGICCTLKTQLYNSIPTSFLSEQYADSQSIASSKILEIIRSCPDNSEAISACINDQCGYGYQCHNNVCCSPQHTNMMLPFSPTTLRPIGGSCEFTQQCVSSIEGLSICELGKCRCLPGAHVEGSACARRYFSMLLNDAEQSSINDTLMNDSDDTVTNQK